MTTLSTRDYVVYGQRLHSNHVDLTYITRGLCSIESSTDIDCTAAIMYILHGLHEDHALYNFPPHGCKLQNNYVEFPSAILAFSIAIL